MPKLVPKMTTAPLVVERVSGDHTSDTVLQERLHLLNSLKTDVDRLALLKKRKKAPAAVRRQPAPHEQALAIATARHPSC